VGEILEYEQEYISPQMDQASWFIEGRLVASILHMTASHDHFVLLLVSTRCGMPFVISVRSLQKTGDEFRSGL
jgi:hypothetical protein